MPYFFNGRLYITPAVMAAVDDSALANQNLSVSNVAAFVGMSVGGNPNTVLSFGSPSEALATLKGGELCQAVMKAFSASNDTGAPGTVLAVRVNPAVQSALVVNDSNSAASINLASADYGAYTNQIKASFAAGSTQGVAATTQIGTAVYFQDNIYSNPMTVVYTGEQSTATLTITGTTLTIDAPSGTPIAAISLAAFPTVQQLVDNINSFAGFTAAVANAFGAAPTLNGLDYVSAQSIKTTPYNVTATLQAVINWLNSPAEGLIVATRASNAGLPPAPLAFTYLTGGSDGSTTNTQWGNAFTALQSASCQWITPISSSGSIAAMTDAHVQYMSTVANKKRRAICGMALGTTDTQAITAALALNSDRTSLVHLGNYDYDLTGVTAGLILYSPYMSAAVVAGAFSGLPPGTAMTNKSLTFRGLERVLLKPTNTDPLIDGGVLCIESDSDGYKVTQSISTWLNDSKFDKVEQSCGWALDFTVQNVLQALKAFKGQKNNQLTPGRAVAVTESQLRLLAKPEPQGPGVLAGDANSPPYLGITATVTGDVIAISFQCSPVIPDNYVAVTVYATPYTGTASA